MSLFASRGVPNVSIACPGAWIGTTVEADSLWDSPVVNFVILGNCGASVEVIVILINHIRPGTGAVAVVG